jgi:phosphomannomutase
MCRELGVRYDETLTGFKWIANRALEIEKATGTRFVFGYEEALGYATNAIVRDKDGITAAVTFLQALARLRREGLDANAALDQIAGSYGRHLTAQASVRVEGSNALERLSEQMAELRANPPKTVGTRDVESITDYLTDDTGLPPSDILRLDLAGGARIMLRPSGTEPKLKVYVELVLPAGDQGARQALDALVADTRALIA